ncbi:MAG: hypothetical protein ACP5HM_16065 [Anaerolineae bacterium]
MEPIEPDVTIAFYPNLRFPFIQSPWEAISEGEQGGDTDDEPSQEQRPTNGRAPVDIFTLIVLVDTQNLKDCHPYTGEGPALIMRTTRWQLEDFCTELKAEYHFLESNRNVGE